MTAIRGLFSGQLTLRESASQWAAGTTSQSNHLATVNNASGRFAAIFHSGEAGNTLCDGSRLYAIVGNPAWRDTELAEISARDGNAAALAFGWRRADLAVLDTITGGYVVAIVDCDSNHLLLAVDRMGIGRLAYAECDQGIVFSDNVDDVARFATQRPSVDPQAVFNYLFFHQVPSPGTIYQGIRKLAASQLLEYRSGHVEVRQYWTPDFSRNSASPRPTTSEMLVAMRSGIKRSIADGRVGTFLSGGLDSSTVTGLASQISASPIPAFTIGFDAPGYDEMSYARTAAEHFNTEHEQYYVTCADVVDSAPHIATNCDEPFGNSSIIPTYFCAKLAMSHGSTTMLAGDGGDELFGGNERYATQKIFEYFQLLPPFLQSLSGKFANQYQDSSVKLFSKFSSYVSQASVPLPDRLETYNLLVMMPLERIFTADFLAMIKPTEPLEMMKSVYDAAGQTDTLNRLIYMDWKFALADNDLRKVQTGCSLAGVTPAFPLLDLDVVDFSLKLPTTDKLRGNTLRPFFRETTRQLLPDRTLSKSKQGFGMPFGVWMRSDAALQSIANDAIAAFAGRNIIRRDFLKWLQEQHESDHASFYGTVIWVIMMLELWLSARDLSLE